MPSSIAANRWATGIEDRQLAYSKLKGRFDRNRGTAKLLARERCHNPRSAPGPFLIVSDIDAARAELIERTLEISEVFHRTAAGGPTVSGRHPASSHAGSLTAPAIEGAARTAQPLLFISNSTSNFLLLLEPRSHCICPASTRRLSARPFDRVGTRRMTAAALWLMTLS